MVKIISFISFFHETLFQGVDIKYRASESSNRYGTLYYFFVFLFLIVSTALIYSFLNDKHLSADGAFYFFSVLEHKTFPHHFMHYRYFFYLFTQWPLVLAVNLGVIDMTSLKLIYALGLYIPYLISFILCSYAVKGQDKFLLIFPILSMIVINLNIDYMLISEAHLMVVLSWPILFFLRKEFFSKPDQIMLILLLVIYSRVYESVVITSIIFIGILLIRMVLLKRKQLLFHQVLIVLCILTFILSLCFSIHPEHPGNRKTFLHSIISIYGYPSVYIPVSFTALLIISILRKNRAIRLALFVPVIWYAYVLLTNDHGLSAGESFSIRTTSLTLLPLLLISSFILSFNKLHYNKAVLSACLFFVSVFIYGNMRNVRDWKSFTSGMIQITQENTGFVHIETTSLNNNLYGWSWTNPELSVVLSPNCVKSIILNKPDTKYKPYDPTKTLILKRYINYDISFLAIDSTINVCGKLNK